MRIRKSTILKCAAASVMILTLLVAQGCSNNSANGKNPEPSAITKEVIGKVKFAEMLEVKSERLKKFYPEVTAETYEKMSLYMCSSAATADEVAVFKAKKDADLKTIEDAIKNRMQQRAATYESYNPTEYNKLKNYVLETKGHYVFVAVCVKPDEARTVFDGFFK